MKRPALAALVAAAAACTAFAANNPELNWVAASRGHIPKASLAAGRDASGEQSYVCRARLANGAETPGTIRQPRVGCSLVHGGIVWTIGAYQVLRDDGPKVIRWLATTEVPQRAYQVGREADGAAVYLCRAKRADGSVHIGKLNGRGCTYGVGGREAKAADFEVLVKP